MRIIPALLAVFFLAGCVAEEPPVTQASPAVKMCGSELALYENFKADIIAKNTDKELLEMYLDKDKSALFVKGYNETPPTDHEDAPTIALWTTRDMLNAHLNHKTPNNSLPAANVLFIDKNTCIKRIEVIPFFILEYLLRGLPYIPGGRSA